MTNVNYKKKVKYYRSQLEKSSPGDEFDAVAVHGNAEVFSPNFKHQPEPEDPISLSTIFDPTKMPIMMKTEEETEEEEEEIFTSPPIKKNITTSLKGKPKVGKKKKTKRKNITIRGTITPVFVNGIDEFSVEDNEINDKEMCDICFQGTEEHGLLICEKCKFKAHEVCIEYRDWRTDPNMEKCFAMDVDKVMPRRLYCYTDFTNDLFSAVQAMVQFSSRFIFFLSFLII